MANYLGQTLSDPFMLEKTTVPQKEEVDVVAALEKELRSEKKKEVRSLTSQMVGSSGVELPDRPGQNTYLMRKAAKYAVEDNVKAGDGVQSKLGDFSSLLAQENMAAEQNSSFARNQLMAMAFSTIHNKSSPAEKIIESQTAYNLAASSFGLNDLEQKSFKRAQKRNKFRNNQLY